ncbi:stage V sporulation protein R [Clostridium amylolyticum]|uniref:Stage V sporulation protein R n=1 Tax=Clostridium amylolyticum TaxID=1121298 RepID=A0A1M6JEX1_9CLOT|nr:SpoVR family protein [Clostridium amylolyticum]SHJ45227.1 stage V sporulation protein R [Clostridium amylolyticum]
MNYSIKDLEKWSEKIEELVKKAGLSFYPQEFEIVSYKEMLGYEAYLGMPSRYPHWSFGKAFEKNRTLYKFNLTGIPYEMVINSNPCIAYLMKDNNLLLQIMTIAHVYGHNDFFKNNRMFKEDTKAPYALEMFKLHSQSIRKYINDPEIGSTKVEKVLNAAHSIRFNTIRSKEEKIVNDKSYNNENNEDLLGFIIKNAEMEEWKRHVLEIVKKETQYFIPQIETKILNEGWASFWHYNILKELGLSQNLYLEFIARHNQVIAPIKNGLNPYYLGFTLFQYLDKKYGRKKVFEIRECDRDYSFLLRHLNEELCSEMNLFQFTKKGLDLYIEEVSDERGWQSIRDTLCNYCGMGAIPIIRVSYWNEKDNSLTLQHVYDGRELNINYAEATLKHIHELWGHKVYLYTKKDNKEVVLAYDDEKKIYQ